MLFHKGLKLEILFVVPIVIFLATTAYFIVNRSLNSYKFFWREMLTEQFKKKQKELFMIISAGILVNTLKQSGLGSKLFHYFLQTVEYVNLNILIGLTLLIILLGIIGLPPVPSMILVSGILVEIPNYPPELIALSLYIRRCYITNNYSSFNGSVINE